MVFINEICIPYQPVALMSVTGNLNILFNAS